MLSLISSKSDSSSFHEWSPPWVEWSLLDNSRFFLGLPIINEIYRLQWKTFKSIHSNLRVWRKEEVNLLTMSLKTSMNGQLESLLRLWIDSVDIEKRAFKVAKIFAILFILILVINGLQKRKREEDIWILKEMAFCEEKSVVSSASSQSND